MGAVMMTMSMFATKADYEAARAEAEAQPALPTQPATMTPLPEPERPNAAGETPCLVRYMLETEHGWVGSWSPYAIPELAKAERKAALLWAAELCGQKAQMYADDYTAEDCAAMLRNEAEKTK